MRYFDLFNGDADGIFALHQLRLAEPRRSRLVSGVKRDLRLFAQIQPTKGDEVTSLDIAPERNRDILLKFLRRGVRVRCFDHHFSKPFPRHSCLEMHIDTSRTVCTSLIVDRMLKGRYRLWAIAAAFGDNLPETAERLARTSGLSKKQTNTLRGLGQLINYNAYGHRISDLQYSPVRLYQKIHAYTDPFKFIQKEDVVRRLRQRFKQDFLLARGVKPIKRSRTVKIFLFPDRPWSRRVSGAFANYSAERSPSQAIAVATPKPGGGYLVGVRTAKSGILSAGEFCARYRGGGRAMAAGVEHLDGRRLRGFIDDFFETFQ